MSEPPSKVTYETYLGLDRLLQCQSLASEKAGERVDEEHLFIIVHQAFELWFKQILDDLRAVLKTFQLEEFDESKHLAGIAAKLGRITLIQKLIIGHFEIIETMPPAIFLNFRKHLRSGSGFESLQFRLIENTIGLQRGTRKTMNNSDYKGILNADQRKIAEQSEEDPSLFDVVAKWLESVFAKYVGDEEKYFEVLQTMLDRWSKDESIDEHHRGKKDSYTVIFKKAEYDSSDKRLSYRAFHGAFLIFLYQEEPQFQQANRTLKLIMDVDAQLSKWRHTHVLMVHRMLGKKMGTGGSSGYDYLMSTNVDDYRVFIELFHMAAFLIPYEYKPSEKPPFK
ncbi:tryptophan 2,3-dioxygenase-like [Ostrea edulis]|uniref:tryptophan 2,3-dioxygenase-like n=1 Tax=Ostrea edulis TaxID=37623 RepID=UPI0024AF9073|nr:tryptophan 2,3-dioxygenase-like [Ostrea edulis]